MIRRHTKSKSCSIFLNCLKSGGARTNFTVVQLAIPFAISASIKYTQGNPCVKGE